jgi:hypothetical protein
LHKKNKDMITANTRFLGVDSTKVNLTEKKDSINNAVTGYYTAEEIVGGGLEGTQYVFVTANGTDVENAAELQAAYDLAKTMSPSSTNRITVIAAPGNYNFGSLAFTMDTQYIDLVSLDGNRSVIFNSSNSAGTISITANDVFVKGIDVLTKSFRIGSNLSLLKVENCKGGNSSFSDEMSTISGTFINCTGGESSFGAFGFASGTFIDCVGGVESFGTFNQASGTFTNCTGGNRSFGSQGTASGTFIDCQGGDYSFGGGAGIASGTFTNCIGNTSSFGGGAGIASGVFNSCIGNTGSFGGNSGILMGKLYYCRLTSGGFNLAMAPGVTRLCIDGNNVENNQG